MSTYNNEDFIEDTILSVLTSTFVNFELLIVNDGSIDGTLQKIQTFKDDRIRVITHDNKGLIYSLNIGLKEAKYDIIARIDGDDLMHPTRLEKQFRIISEFGYDVVGSNALLIDYRGKIFGEVVLPKNHIEIKESLLRMTPSIIHPSVMFRRSVVFSIGSYNYDFLHAEDYHLWLSLIDTFTFYNIQDNLIYLRKHKENVSHRGIVEQILNTYTAWLCYKTKSVSPKRVREFLLKFKTFNFMLNLYKYLYLNDLNHDKVKFFPVFFLLKILMKIHLFVFGKFAKRIFFNKSY